MPSFLVIARYKMDPEVLQIGASMVYDSKVSGGKNFVIKEVTLELLEAVEMVCDFTLEQYVSPEYDAAKLVREFFDV